MDFFGSSSKLFFAADEEVSVGAYADIMKSFWLFLIYVAVIRSDLQSMEMTSGAILLLYRWATPWNFNDDVVYSSFHSPYR